MVPEKSPGGLSGTNGAASPEGAENDGVAKSPRIPPPFDGIQANYCRNTACVNFAVPPLPKVTHGTVKAGEERVSDGYRVSGSKTGEADVRRLFCTQCGSETYLRSNQAIVEELHRISGYMDLRPEPSCRTETCASRGKGVRTHASLYHANGKTAAGSPRWTCKACGKSLSDRKRGRTQRRSNENLTVFRGLVNKLPIRGLARMTELSPKAVYDKIEFIHRQCLAFVADRERHLPEMPIKRLWLSTDRQDYVLNWSNRRDRRNAQLTAVGTADNVTGYVFGQHLNYDPDAVPGVFEALADAAGDFDGRGAAFRRYARLWLRQEYEATVRRAAGVRRPRRRGAGIEGMIEERLEEEALAEDPEALDRVDRSRALPKRGMQVHVEYTVAAHYELLRHLVGHAERIRFFIDQDDTLRAGCLGAFAGKVKAGQSDVFFVQIDKDRTVDERRRLTQTTADELSRVRLDLKNPKLTNLAVRRLLIRRQIEAFDPALPWRRRWVLHPVHTMYEPEKAVCHASDRGDLEIDRVAALMDRASLHGIDRFFMQLRRMLSLLERPIATPSNTGRVWRGYSPYNPAMVQQLIDIYRVYYNYAKVGEPWKGVEGVIRPSATPAMRLGLARGPVRIADILYFSG
jgi:transposase-like protein